MSELLPLIIKHPCGFFLVCCGLALLLRSAGTHEALPKLLRFFELVLQRLWREFTKKRGERTAIELIDFVLVIFFGTITLLATLCLLLPSGIAQAVGVGANFQEGAIRCFLYSIVLFLITGIVSGTLVVVSDKDSAARALLQKLMKQPPSST